jgi:hypothetical protein
MMEGTPIMASLKLISEFSTKWEIECHLPIKQENILSEKMSSSQIAVVGDYQIRITVVALDIVLHSNPRGGSLDAVVMSDIEPLEKKTLMGKNGLPVCTVKRLR